MPKGVTVQHGASYFGAGKLDAPREDVARRLAERDLRYAHAAARPDDPNRIVLGDPPPGRSMLDRRR
jgi:hypothetical protein